MMCTDWMCRRQVFTKALEPEQLIAHVSDVRGALRHVALDLKGELLPGFCLPKVNVLWYS